MTRIPSPLPPDLRTGILHLGLGAFHRAHQAPFTQDAIAAAGGDWGIEAVSMRNPDLAERLNAQQGRYTLVERHPDGPRLSEISVIRRAHALPGNVASVAARMADPSIHVVTITVTEKGYCADLATRTLDRGAAGVAADLRATGEPRSLPGLLALGLSLRQKAGLGGLTLISCDNLPENGRLLAALVGEFAAATDSRLAHWIADNCAFPSAMVDRITPASSGETFALVEAETGSPDPVAVETEPFRQWVIEDRFAGPRPAWEAAGAEIVADVVPFEAMKLRCLNGAHSLIAYAGALAGLDAVRDVMAEDALAAMARLHMARAATTLPEAPGLDPAAYADALVRRFANPAIRHSCRQIAMDGSQKLPQRIFAPAREALAAGLPTDTFAFATAAWIAFVSDPDGPLDDPLADALRTATGGQTPEARLAALARLPGLAHDGLLDTPRFADAVVGHLRQIEMEGVRAAARRLLAAG